jgi:hypothetical protein
MKRPVNLDRPLVGLLQFQSAMWEFARRAKPQIHKTTNVLRQRLSLRPAIQSLQDSIVHDWDLLLTDLHIASMTGIYC